MLLGAQLLLSFVVGLSVLALVIGVRALVSPSESSDRIQQLMGEGAPITLRELEMHESFYQRAIQPVVSALLQGLSRLAPGSNIEVLHKKLETGGFPGNLTVVDFLGLKILIGIVLAVFIALLTRLVRPDYSFIILGGVGLLFGLFGFFMPNVWLWRRIAQRQHEIRRNLPDALDMMTICVDAGLGLSGAMQRVVESWNNALIEEFTRVLNEVRVGRTRIEALESMAERTQVSEIQSFVMALTLADQLGVSIAQVLHIQSQQMRIARRQKAEEAAREASIKMLFPLVFLIFPSMFAVILGPAVPLLLETLTEL